jgi:hypothetical protein
MAHVIPLAPTREQKERGGAGGGARLINFDSRSCNQPNYANSYDINTR